MHLFSPLISRTYEFYTSPVFLVIDNNTTAMAFRQSCDALHRSASLASAVRARPQQATAHALKPAYALVQRCAFITSIPRNNERMINSEINLPAPTPVDRTGETLEVARKRLIYQSRKRGMLENDLLLSTFADSYLATLAPEVWCHFLELVHVHTPCLHRSPFFSSFCCIYIFTPILINFSE